MTIKHLVISGGGPYGISFLGILEYLHDKGFWKIEDIESIYATSIGTILSTVICLNYDWETINKYFIERPWKDIFKVSAKQIMDAYTNKGIYDIKIIDKILKPLLEAKDLSLTITLKEFYEYTKKELYFYAFDLNTYKTVEISYKEYPDLLLTKAIYMSCTLPGIFIPTFIDNKCIIDGGSLANFPINYCLRDHINKDEILGINFIYSNSDGSTCSGNNIITTESNILDFILALSVNSINYITTSIKSDAVPYIVEYLSSISSLTMDSINNFINTIEGRQLLFDKGIECGKLFFENCKMKNTPINLSESDSESDSEVNDSDMIVK